MSCKSTDYANARKVRHGDWRDDRPPYGRGGRASTDGLAACRRVNAMAPPPLYAYINTIVLSISSLETLSNLRKQKSDKPHWLIAFYYLPFAS